MIRTGNVSFLGVEWWERGGKKKKEKKRKRADRERKKKRGLVLGGGGEEGMARALSGGWSCLLPGVVGVLRGSAIFGAYLCFF